MSSVLLRSIFFILIFMITEAARPVSPQREGIAIKVKFDHSYYSLQADSKNVVYQQGSLLFSMLRKECNKAVVDRLVKQYQRFADEYAAKKKQRTTASEYDVEILRSTGPSWKISRGSPFGTWLRDLPKKIMYYKAEAEVQCHPR